MRQGGEMLECSGISWTICKQSAPRSRQLTTLTLHFYRPDALPGAQPTALKQRKVVQWQFKVVHLKLI